MPARGADISNGLRRAGERPVSVVDAKGAGGMPALRVIAVGGRGAEGISSGLPSRLVP
jgi:hypothetical protein